MNFVNEHVETYIAKQNYVCIPFDYSLLRDRYTNYPITVLSINETGFIDHVVVFDSILLYKLINKSLDTLSLRSVADLSLRNSLSDRSRRYLNRQCFKLYNKTKGIQINNKNQNLYIVMDLNKIDNEYRYYESGKLIESEAQFTMNNESEATGSEAQFIEGRYDVIRKIEPNNCYSIILFFFYILLFSLPFINEFSGWTEHFSV